MEPEPPHSQPLRPASTMRDYRAIKSMPEQDSELGFGTLRNGLLLAAHAVCQSLAPGPTSAHAEQIGALATSLIAVDKLMPPFRSQLTEAADALGVEETEICGAYAGHPVNAFRKWLAGLLETYWREVRFAAIRAGVLDAEQARQLHGSSPIWTILAGNTQGQDDLSRLVRELQRRFGRLALAAVCNEYDPKEWPESRITTRTSTFLGRVRQMSEDPARGGRQAPLSRTEKPTTPSAPGPPFVSPSTWEELTVTLLNDTHVELDVKGQEPVTLTLRQARLCRASGAEPKELWHTLCVFADNYPGISALNLPNRPDGSQLQSPDNTLLRQQVSQLRKWLRNMAALDGDPFHAEPKKDRNPTHRKVKLYRPRFHMRRL